MKVNTKDEIIKNLKQYQDRLTEFGVNQIGLFGSFVTDKAQETSDLDIFVVFQPEQKTFQNFMALSFFLEDLFERPVDLVTPESLSPHFGSKILDEVEYVSFS
jgi:hypothetical protein